MMDAETSGGSDLYHEEVGEGGPILLIHPSGSTGSTWGPVVEELTRVGRVITYDRRGYARSGGEPVRKLSTHSADAAALLESLQAPPAVVVGTSSGAMIALDLAVRRPDLVRAVVEHEGPWRFTRHLPTGPQLRTFATMGSFVLRARHSDAAEVLLRSAYAYREGGTAWDAFPEEWRRAGRENGKATLWDFLISIGNHPAAADSRASKSRSCAVTAHAVPISWPDARGRSLPSSPPRGRIGSKGRLTQLPSTHQPTSCS
jgi:pimeloyl-ACP methyl ester carboxylesterase